MEIAIIQNEIVPISELASPQLDRGVYFGDGVYEVVRSYNGRIFAMDEHMARFTGSLTAINIIGVDIEQVRQKVINAYQKADIANAKIYFHITRGSHLRSHLPARGLEPNFFLTVTDLGDDTEQETNGIAVSTHPDQRWKRCDIKSLNLLPNILARMEADKNGSDEAILVNDKGEITEGAGSAFFMVLSREKKLITRPLGCDVLPSITRDIVMQIAPRLALETLERPITPSQAENADELFIAVTTRDIVPVVKFDGKKIANGKPGKYTKLLMNEFQNQIKKSGQVV